MSANSLLLPKVLATLKFKVAKYLKVANTFCNVDVYDIKVFTYKKVKVANQGCKVARRFAILTRDHSGNLQNHLCPCLGNAAPLH